MRRSQERSEVAVREPEPDPLDMRAMAAAQLRTLLKRYDTAEFQAQTHACRMVDMLAGFADDIFQPVEFRRQCANDILDRAYGKPATKARVEIVDTSAKTAEGMTVGDEIQAAIVTADVFRRVNDLTMRQIPFSEWPDDVKAAVGEEGAVAFSFSETG